MHLYILEFTYAAEDRETVEAWLAQAGLSGVLISTEQYDDEIFAVLVHSQILQRDLQKLVHYPGISSSQIKQRVLYRITTTSAPESAFTSFPMNEGDEWYVGGEKTIYLSVQSQKLSYSQISWLAACTEIAAWEHTFDLTPLSIRRKSY